MAEKTLHALEYLAKPDKHAPRPVTAIYGNEAFLRRQTILKLREAALGGEEGDFSFTSVEGDKAQWHDVREDLATLAMFGGQRLVLVEEADDFVAKYRSELEDYVNQARRAGVLALELTSFPANTRLYKMVAAEGLAIDCSTPAPAKLTKWLIDWANHFHRTSLSQASAETLVEIVGPELGLLDQEIAKLAQIAGNEKITPEMVSKYVGGWRAKTTWEMLDAALDGKVREAIQQLDRLLSSGEQPIGILAQISATLRRFAAATRLILLAETGGRRIPLSQSLQRAGVKPFVMQKAERQLRRLGRNRGEKLYQWLLEADLDLKGNSALPTRLILERLIIRLAAPA
jgi:DNA polymerase III subunit delta